MWNKKYPCVLQHEQSDCAAAVVATILSVYKNELSIMAIRDVIGTDMYGTTVKGIVTGLKKLYFDVKPIRVLLNEITAEVTKPLILQTVNELGANHFVVLHHITKNGKYVIADPAKGQIVMVREQQEQTILESELVELENQKSVKETEVESLKTEIKQLERNNHYTQGHQTYLQLVSELGNEYSQVEQVISELKGNMQVNEKRDANHTVHATGEGIVHYHTPLKIGTTLQQGQVIAEISKHDESTYYVETFVPTTEISKVKVGQKVDLAVVGVNVQKYGTLKGTIQTIDTGVVTQRVEQSNQQFYRIHVALDSKTLAHGNQEIKLVLSMPVEVRIVYDEETYFDWLLEQLRFKN